MRQPTYRLTVIHYNGSECANIVEKIAYQFLYYYCTVLVYYKSFYIILGCPKEVGIRDFDCVLVITSPLIYVTSLVIRDQLNTEHHQF